MSMIRLDKYLADMGYGTRSEVKQLVRHGQVVVDGNICKDSGCKVDTDVQSVVCQGKNVGYTDFAYYMLNKPAGVVSATEDQQNKTVLDCIADKKRKDLFPVGRLDKDTEGLLLITNDGPLAHDLLSPKKHVEKTYYAQISGIVTEDMVKQFAKGLDIGEEKLTRPAKLSILNAGEISEIEVTITEGKYHQVKRMFQAVGTEVIYLKRLSMGDLILDDNLEPGQYRLLTEEELKRLRKNNEK